MRFVDKVSEILKERKITQKKLLSDLHMGTNQFQEWRKNGREPNISSKQAIASYLGVTVGYLEGTENETALPQTVEELSDYERHIVELLRQAPQGTDAAILQLLQLRSASDQ